MKYLSNSGAEFIVLEEFRQKRNSNKGSHIMWLIQFTETGTTLSAMKCNAIVGKVRDPYQRTVCGVGYLGNFNKTPYWKQAKQLWRNMLKRCYNPKDTKGYFGVCTVDARWLNFANFVEDLPKLNNFDKWLEGQNGGAIKYNLDKDLLVKGNKVYTKLACAFVEESVNKAGGAKNGKPFTKQNKMG